jgi:hypothetical protein
MKQICSLGFEKAVEAIKDTETVQYKHGVWNPYKERLTKDVVELVMKSGYGADVSQDDDGIFYVAIPCDADMW